MAGATTKAARPTQDTTEKAKKAKRPTFDRVGHKDPNVYPFKVSKAGRASPDGYDFGKHRPLKRKDFAKPSAFFIYQAEASEWKAARLRDKAKELIASGDGVGAGKAKRLRKALERAAELRKELEAQGYNVEEMLKAAETA